MVIAKKKFTDHLENNIPIH